MGLTSNRQHALNIAHIQRIGCGGLITPLYVLNYRRGCYRLCRNYNYIPRYDYLHSCPFQASEFSQQFAWLQSYLRSLFGLLSKQTLGTTFIHFAWADDILVADRKAELESNPGSLVI